jgi:hypothetical protein
MSSTNTDAILARFSENQPGSKEHKELCEYLTQCIEELVDE